MFSFLLVCTVHVVRNRVKWASSMAGRYGKLIISELDPKYPLDRSESFQFEADTDIKYMGNGNYSASASNIVCIRSN